MNTTWEVIKEFYQREFGIDGWVVEMYANLDILSLCVSGASNENISKLLELPIAEIIKVLSDTFEFEGWKKDLPINPYRVWRLYDGDKSSIGHFVSFNEEVGGVLSKYSEDYGVSCPNLFYICEVFNDIEGRIQDEWI